VLLPIVFAFLAFASTLLGGLVALRNSDRLHRILGYTAGVILGVIAFDLLPEIFHIVEEQQIDPVWPMLALVGGFLLIHIVEKTVAIHQAHDKDYADHTHPRIGQASALALIAHTFLDGVGIALGFQVNAGVGIAVAVAVLAHDFTDGLNTVALMLTHRNNRRRSIIMLLLAAIAPILGALTASLIHFEESILVIYLGFITGFFLYIGVSDILPQAHSKNSSKITIALTVLGVAVMFVITRFMGHGH
jgi:ZIP family zinc transporter